jgi:hypothetical protein
MIISKRNNINGVEILTLENNCLKTEIVPALGGKILSVFNKFLNKEFLWCDKNLQLNTQNPGDDFDSSFYGGIDELIPNDIAETIDSIQYPDHGELWTTPLNYELGENKIYLFGNLRFSGFQYRKDVYLDENDPVIYLEYKIRNESGAVRNFSWKFHAALSIQEGDKIVSDALNVRVIDTVYSRFKTLEEFKWPVVENCNVSVVPPSSNTMDFFCLYKIRNPEMHLESPDKNSLFSLYYDKKVFPYQGYFASYGGFFNHYTLILEPCTNMPLSVPEAIKQGQCSVLGPNEEINTLVSIYAGQNHKIINKPERISEKPELLIFNNQ